MLRWLGEPESHSNYTAVQFKKTYIYLTTQIYTNIILEIKTAGVLDITNLQDFMIFQLHKHWYFLCKSRTVEHCWLHVAKVMD